MPKDTAFLHSIPPGCWIDIFNRGCLNSLVIILKFVFKFQIEALGTQQGVPLKRVVVHKCGQIIND